MKKVLVITYYWPPAGGPGVQRWLKFVTYLKEHGIDPVVYIPSNPFYPLVDNSLKKEVPGDITILKNRIFEPYFLAKLFSKKQTETISSGIIAGEKSQTFLQKFLLYIRGNLFIPDARKFWVKPSIKYLSGYIESSGIDTIITTGPPHSIHLIGLGLKEKFNLKWVADFRDPWTKIGYHKKLKLSESSEIKHEKLELKVLTEASHIITTSFTTTAEFEKMTPRPVTTITNGYDGSTTAEENLDKKFTISHIGSLLSGRNPHNLWMVLAELIAENQSFAEDFKLQLTGAVSETVLNSLDQYGLSQYLDLKGYVDHGEAIKMQRRSQVLLLVEIDSVETRGIIPGKLFEYIAARRPIIALGPVKWDVERILYETASGNFFDYTNKEELKYRILAYYHLYQQNSLTSNSSKIDKYSRQKLTGQLANVINQL